MLGAEFCSVCALSLVVGSSVVPVWQSGGVRGRLVIYVKLWCGRRSLADRFLVYSLDYGEVSVAGTS